MIHLNRELKRKFERPKADPRDFSLSQRQWNCIKRWALDRSEKPDLKQLILELECSDSTSVVGVLGIARRYGAIAAASAAKHYADSNSHLFGTHTEF